jgi:hypothetical protein
MNGEVKILLLAKYPFVHHATFSAVSNFLILLRVLEQIEFVKYFLHFLKLYFSFSINLNNEREI